MKRRSKPRCGVCGTLCAIVIACRLAPGPVQAQRAASDSQQAASDNPQAASDNPQATSGSQQAASDNPQAASNNPQAAGDNQQVAGETTAPIAPPKGRIIILPNQLPYRRDQPVPDGYRLELHENRALAIGGASVFGLTYLIALALAVGDEGVGAPDALLIPVAGPFVAATQVQHEENPAGARGGYIALGALEAVGVSLMILSELFPIRRFVLSQRESPALSSLRWSCSASRNGSGAAVNVGAAF
jgi:hypothetical protein